MLIASRAVQGIGAALLMPATLAIIVATFTNARERDTAIGIWGAVGALALALGPALGGLISQHLHWGWIFLINVPIGVLTFAIAVPYYRRVAGRTAAEPAVRGAGAAARSTCPAWSPPRAALFALTYALIEGQRPGLDVPAHPRRVRAGRRGRRALPGHRVPQSPARWSRCRCSARREFSGGTGTMMIWAFGVLGIYFFTSLYLQQTLGFSPVKAGLAFVPMALCVAVFAAAGRRG